MSGVFGFIHHRLIREMPALAHVLTTDDELRFTRNRSAHIAAQVVRKVRQGAHRFAGPFSPAADTLYADCENCLRVELREWVEGILFDECTLAREIFRPAALRSLMDRHLAGHEPLTLGKIAHLVTFEMMLRQIGL